VVSGVLDSISAGILLYTALVELISKDFLSNPEMKNKSMWEMARMVGYVLFGAFSMALFGKWI
jgi:solute carrier family 39 (zinc transporter), member 1/2/3